MRIKNIALIWILILTQTYRIYGQKLGFEIGVKGGANYSVSQAKEMDIKNPLTFHAGAYAEIILPLIGVQVEAKYSAKAASLNVNGLFTSSTTTLNYVQVPLILEYTTLFGIATIQTGPEFGFLLDKNTKIPGSTKELYNNFDISWLFGLRGNIPLTKWHIFARYIVGINDVNTANSSKTDQIQLGIDIGLLGKKIGRR